MVGDFGTVKTALFIVNNGLMAKVQAERRMIDYKQDRSIAG